MYGLQLLIAGRLSMDAAYTVVPRPPSIEYFLLTPWVHSSHLHVLENLTLFGIFGWWTERQLGTDSFVVVVLVAGYLTNLLPSVIGIGGLGVGLSGVTNMLAGYVTVKQLWLLSKGGLFEANIPWTLLWCAVSFFLGLIIVVHSIAEFTGLIDPATGIATGVHFVGVMLGFAVAIVTLRNVTGRGVLDG